MKLKIRNPSKQYRRDFWSLRDFSLDASPGVIGLLGPNGRPDDFCAHAPVLRD